MATVPIPDLNPENLDINNNDLFAVHIDSFNRTRKVKYQTVKNKLASDLDVATNASLNSQVAALTAAINNAVNDILQNKVFPVGSTYMSRTSTTNPATILGFGTWVKVEDRVIMAHGSSFPTLGATGGSATHDHGGSTNPHTLTESQMPSHVHPQRDRYMAENSGVLGGPSGAGNFEFMSPSNYNGGIGSRNPDFDNNAFLFIDTITGATGGASGHSHGVPSSSNLPPYVVHSVYVRTA